MTEFNKSNFPFKYFLGEITAEFDSKDRPTRIEYVEEGYPENYLRIDYDKQNGTYSDESYAAQNFNKGTVEEIHLGQVAHTSKNVDFNEWIQASYLQLHLDLAVKHASYLFEFMDEDNLDDIEDYYNSFLLYLDKAQCNIEDQLNYVQLGWAACSILLKKDVEKATAIFKALYKKEKDSLPISEEKINQHLLSI